MQVRRTTQQLLWTSATSLISPQDAREKQTLITAHSLLAEGGKEMHKADDHGGSKGSAGLSLGEGLPPIPHKLVEKILREEFVEM